MTDPIPAAAEVVLHQEQLRVGTQRVPSEKVLVRRRVVSEVRQTEVTVRREELEVHRLPLDWHEEPSVGGPPGPLVIFLSEEVPVVHLANSSVRAGDRAGRHRHHPAGRHRDGLP